MIIYGRNAVHEANRGPRRIKEIWATTGAMKEPWLSAVDAPVNVNTGDQIADRCGSDGHQGICADVADYRYLEGEQLLTLSRDAGERGPRATDGGSPLIIALDQVQDPQNLGAIARSAECAGAVGLVLPERRAAEVTPAVCKASAGAVEHLPLAQVRNLTDFLTEAKAKGFWVYGADGDADMDYREVDFSGPVVIVMGSEGKGLRPRVASACDALISLPLRGKIESLSVGAAAAVLMYAAAASR